MSRGENTNLPPVPSVRQVLAAAARTSRTNLLAIAAITLIVYVPVDVALAFVPTPEAGGWKAWRTYFRVSQLLEFWIGTIASLAIIHVTHLAGRGTEVSIGDAFRRAFERLRSGLWATFLFQVAFVIGLLLLVVPGIAAGVFLAFHLPLVVIGGRTGWQALEESHLLVKGRWWRFFGRFFQLGLMLLGAVVLVSIPAAFLPENPAIEVITGIPMRLTVAWYMMCLTHLYLLSAPQVPEPDAVVFP